MPSNQNQNNSIPERLKKKLAVALNNTTHQNKRPSAPNLMINGVPQSPTTAKGRMAISMSTATLSNMGIMQHPVIGQKTNRLSEIFLNAIGVSIIDSERGFSLMTERKETTILDPEQEENFGNPNILDSNQYSFLKNENVQVVDSFPNSADPFYQLDSTPTSEQAKMVSKILDIEKKPDTIKVSSHMSQVNFIQTKDSQKLKYFNSAEARTQHKWSLT